MSEEELERTDLMKTMMIDQVDDEDEEVIEDIEQFEDKIDYLDISKEKCKKLHELCDEIKKEENLETREYLLKLLQKEID